MYDTSSSQHYVSQGNKGKGYRKGSKIGRSTSRACAGDMGCPSPQEAESYLCKFTIVLRINLHRGMCKTFH